MMDMFVPTLTQILSFLTTNKILHCLGLVFLICVSPGVSNNQDAVGDFFGQILFCLMANYCAKAENLIASTIAKIYLVVLGASGAIAGLVIVFMSVGGLQNYLNASGIQWRKKRDKQEQERYNKDFFLPTEESEKVIDHSRMSVGDFELLGVSVFYLATHFLDEIRDEVPANFWNYRRAKDYKINEIETLSDKPDDNCVIRKKGKDVKCPISGEQGAAYVHTLSSVDHVGRATIMLSYVWEYTIGEIVDVLLNYCKKNRLDPSRVYVWICCLCINQHQVIGRTIEFEVFRNTFFNRVNNIDHVLAMMTPWTKPLYIYRIWCLFELYTAKNLGGKSKLIIEMPSSQKKMFIEGLADDAEKQIEQLFDTLRSTGVEKARATKKADQDNILRIVKDKVQGESAGFNDFNDVINSLIRDWVVQLILDEAEKRWLDLKDDGYNEGGAKFFRSLGSILYRIGRYEHAFVMYSKELEMIMNPFCCVHSYLIKPLDAMANILKKEMEQREASKDKPDDLSDFCEDTMKKYLELLPILAEKYLDKSEQRANVLRNFAFALEHRGNREEAIKRYERSLKIFTHLKGGQSPEVVQIRKAILKLKKKRRRFIGR